MEENFRKPIDILMIETDAKEVERTRQGLAMADLPANLQVVADGKDALAVLRQEGRYAGGSRPDSSHQTIGKLLSASTRGYLDTLPPRALLRY